MLSTVTPYGIPLTGAHSQLYIIPADGDMLEEDAKNLVILDCHCAWEARCAQQHVPWYFFLYSYCDVVPLGSQPFGVDLLTVAYKNYAT